MRKRVGSLALALWAGGLPAIAHKLRCALGLRRPMPFPRIALASSFWQPEEGGSARSRGPDSRGSPHLFAVSHNLSLEGASISLVDLLRGLSEAMGNADVTVVSYADGPLRQTCIERGFSVHVLDPSFPAMTTLARLSAFVERLAGLIRKVSPSIVIANTLLGFPAVLAARQCGVRSLWIPRESEPWSAYFRFLPDPLAEQALSAMALADDVVFVAEATRRVWRDFERWGSFHVIHNALQPERIDRRGDFAFREASRRALNLAESDVLLLNVGTLCARKGQDDLLRALAALPAPQAGGRLKVMFVGDPGDRYGARLRVRSSAAAGRERPGCEVVFAPATPDVCRYLAAADVFVLCSRVESHPRVVLEAMAFGLPVVATRVFGVLEQVTDGEGAWLYEPGDIGHLARHLQALVSDGVLRKRMGKASARRFEALESYEQMVSEYLSVIDGSRPVAGEPLCP